MSKIENYTFHPTSMNIWWGEKWIWWGEKWSVFRGSFKPESEFIWSNIALNRSFCDFRCLESEFWKRGYFGRFWSIKWRKQQSTKSKLELQGDGVKDLLLTASERMNILPKVVKASDEEMTASKWPRLIYRGWWRRHIGRHKWIKGVRGSIWRRVDGVRFYSWRRQDDFPIYSFLVFSLKREKFWWNPKDDFGASFTGFSRVPNPWDLAL